MARKPKKGYFVRGQFVAEGSELDLQLKAELKHFQDNSKTELKRESTELQKLGEQLMSLRAELFERLQLPSSLVDAMDEARRITNFEGKRRQMQYVGKLMRQLDPEQVEAARAALEEQRAGSAQATLALHAAERWREELVASDQAVQDWLARHPGTDSQQLRALVRQARKDRQATQDEISKGLAPRHGRAWREIFQIVKETLQDEQQHDEPAAGEREQPGD
jgi:ribosome-associated protein